MGNIWEIPSSNQRWQYENVKSIFDSCRHHLCFRITESDISFVDRETANSWARSGQSHLESESSYASRESGFFGFIWGPILDNPDRSKNWDPETSCIFVESTSQNALWGSKKGPIKIHKACTSWAIVSMVYVSRWFKLFHAIQQSIAKWLPKRAYS